MAWRQISRNLYIFPILFFFFVSCVCIYLYFFGYLSRRKTKKFSVSSKENPCINRNIMWKLFNVWNHYHQLLLCERKCLHNVYVLPVFVCRNWCVCGYVCIWLRNVCTWTLPSTNWLIYLFIGIRECYRVWLCDGDVLGHFIDFWRYEMKSLLWWLIRMSCRNLLNYSSNPHLRSAFLVRYRYTWSYLQSLT
jgi:hypothetical protein